ncbi:AAA family ATPase [Saccharopolyspora hattusasensis]|uniref:AAA family ATPase n=1 Tax=Saccharopolyspora hattusasensis TaxID=1128679 RepID=UPI003D99CD7F
MFNDPRLTESYPLLSKLSDPLKKAERKIVGREREQMQLLASMSRAELCNALLLAEAGTGKTALAQATMLADKKRLYLEVDPARMIFEAGDGDLMASMLKGFFDEAERFVKDEGQELVLVIDEFHQIVQLSDAAVEAIKPVLAASGIRGIRIIAATTYDEFHKHISPNQPLVERLQRINLNPPDQDTTIEILQGMAERYGVADQFYDDHIFRQIYEYTQRYMPASAQPRKSILVLDSMVGWHRLTKRPMDRELLSEVLQESLGVNVAFKVDGAKIKQQLDAKVFSQDLATSAVARRLQLSVADLNDKSRPEASMLFTGSTGVGKATTCSTEIPVWSADGSVSWKKAGALVPGDFCFARDGRPQTILGVFPQGECEVYRVTLGDGRTLDVSDNHLWAVYPSRQSREQGPTIYSTQTLMNKGLVNKKRDGRQGMKYVIPMNEAVQWPVRDLAVHPYVMGAAIGDGCLHPTHDHAFHLSSMDEELVARVAELLDAEHVRNERNFGRGFRLPEPRRTQRGRWPGSHAVVQYVQVEDLVGDLPEVRNKTSEHKRIPEPYMTASIEQRWDLVRGLFDTDGTIGQADGDRYNVSYSTTSEGLALDVQRLLYSLGVSSTIGTSDREGKTRTEYIVRVKTRNMDKERFFALSRKREIAQHAAGMNKHREKTLDYVGIRSIEKLGHTEPMVCIYVDDDEHLYQAGDFVVTHNTELTKQLAKLLFGDDQRHLIRFDMSEFAQDSSLRLFRSELTKKVWDLSHAVLLFDEIEKASPMVTRVLLQVLDDGRLSDDNNREVSFLNTYIVLTTNAGSEIYKTIAQYAEDDTGSGKQLEEYKKLIRRSISDTSAGNRFPPELLGRIDTIVPFQPLSLATQEKIVRNKLRQMIQEVLVKHNVRTTVDKKVLQYLVEDKGDTDSDAGGARVAVAKMTEEVTTAVATFINEHSSERRIRIDVVGDLVSDDKGLLRSDAHVEVSAVR